MFSPRSGKGFKRSLHDPLTADINPRTGRHLSIHRQSQPFEAIELGIVVPLTDKIGVGDQNARRFIVCSKFSDRFPRLNEKRLVVFKIP
jgi:hypothetical protein